MTTAPTVRGSTGTILLYHRVAELDSDPWALAVTPKHFDEHLQALRIAGATIVSLDALISARKDAAELAGTVAITFDDGYTDVLHAALPILERHDVPATVFVPTGGLGDPREFWWDELERIVLHTPVLPPHLQLDTAGQTRNWNLQEMGAVRKGMLPRDWLAWGQPDPTGRHRLFRELYEAVYPLHGAERVRVQDHLLMWAEATPITGFDGPRVVTRDELATLAASPLVTIGAHSVSHPLLARQSPDQQRSEIRDSKRCLEDLLGTSVASFAYPFGKVGDYSAMTVRLVQEAGFTSALANRPGQVDSTGDGYQLPRRYVLNGNGEEFARQLNDWWGE